MRKYLDAFVTAVRDRVAREPPTKPTEPTSCTTAGVVSVLSVESRRVCSKCNREPPVMLAMGPGIDGRMWFLCADCRTSPLVR